MPVMSTLKTSVITSLCSEKSNNCNNIIELVNEITGEILGDVPYIVADVANNKQDREVLETEIIKRLDSMKVSPPGKRNDFIKKVFDFMFGYGQLQPYIEDEEISDIDGTGYREFVVKKNGKRKKIEVDFGCDERLDTYCRLIAVRNKGLLNENDSHCRVTDEKMRLRINLSIKPRNIFSPSINIRKHRMKSYTLKELNELGMINDIVLKYFNNLANTDYSVVFCGKGAAGKTTLLRAFVNSLPEMERVLITESDSEIYPDKPYCIQQRIKKSSEGGREVTLKDLVRDGLTMSLDTYVIGEITGSESLDFIKACFSGHRGLATTHSENAKEALTRLMTLGRSEKNQEKEETINEMLASGIDVIVYLKNFKVEEILKVNGWNKEKKTFSLEMLYNCKKDYDKGLII